MGGSCMSKPAAAGGAPTDAAALSELMRRLQAAEEELRALRQQQHQQQDSLHQHKGAAKQARGDEQPTAVSVAAGAQASRAGAAAAAAAAAAPSRNGPGPADAQPAAAAAGASPPPAPSPPPPAPPPRQGSGGALAAALAAVAVPPAPPSAAPLPSAVPMEATRIVMHQIVAPAECDGHGVCTGGQVLCWIDICAGLSAKTLARGPCVTISVDAVHFIRPCRLGQVVIVAAMVNRTFSSSMEVGVRVEAEDMRTGVRYHCCSAYLTFVSLRSRSQQAQQQPDAKPQPLPRIVPVGLEQQAIYEQAESRRQDRLSRRQSLAGDPRRAEEVEKARLRPVTHREGCPTLPPPLTLLPGSGLGAAGEKARVSPAATTAYMTQSIMPQHANTLGITFGGQVMSWMEQCAYISASRLRGLRHLTAGMDSVTLARTTKVGDVLYVTAQVTAIFNSSLEVAVTVFGESPSEGVVFHCADACVTVVVVDPEGGPSTIPFALDPQTPNQQLRYQAALRRRRERLAMRQALLREVAAKKLLDGSFTRMASYGSCNLLQPLATTNQMLRRGSLSGGGSGIGNGSGGGNGVPQMPRYSSASGGGGGGARPSLAAGSGGGSSEAESPVGRSVGVCQAPRAELLSPKGGPRSAPVSPGASPKAAARDGLRQPLVLGPLTNERSAHEYFDNW